MAYTTINKGSDYFNTKTYTGNATTDTAQTGIGFQPDWLWIKERAGTGSHILVDAVRGVSASSTPFIKSNSTGPEVTSNTNDFIKSLDVDGFTLGADSYFTDVNKNSSTYVAWNWRASGTSGSSNGDGSITSTVSANTTSGFSIVKYTGNESGAPKTVGHGLGVAPKMIMIKRLNDTINWGVYHESLGNTKVMFLNTSDTPTTSSAYWNDTTPTNSVFTVNSNHTVNHTGSDFIAYCFAEKIGYSKFGDYTGNGNTDGTFVYTGFKPAFVIVKNTTASANWVSTDNGISFNGKGSNGSTCLFPSSNAVESDAYGLEMYSNGFKFKGSDSASATVNASGNIYIYMAFAKAPLVGSNNIPATAR